MLLRIAVFVLIMFAFSFGINVTGTSAIANCTVDEDCQIANIGNVCMNGICGNAQLPVNGSQPPVQNITSQNVSQYLTCNLDSDCPNAIPGPVFICQNNNCKPTGGYLCSIDQHCPSSEGNSCIAGVCGWTQKQNELCPVSFVFLGLLGSCFFFYK